jgi:hypothetical protein
LGFVELERKAFTTEDTEDTEDADQISWWNWRM